MNGGFKMIIRIDEGFCIERDNKIYNRFERFNCGWTIVSIARG